MALTKISTGGVKDDAASQAKIADEAVDEARLQISNAGTNGQFLSKQSGNTGGWTWADAITSIADDSITQAKIADDAIGQDQLAQNAVVADNLTEDCVTSAKIADAAVTEYRIADNNVPESKLKVSNSPTNGQLLSAQSGNTGGLTWTDPPASAPQIEATADGAITAGKPVIVNTNGTVKQAGVGVTEESSYSIGGVDTQLDSSNNINQKTATYHAHNEWYLVAYKNLGDNNGEVRGFKYDSASSNTLVYKDEETYVTSEVQSPSITYVPDRNRSIILYQDDSDSQKGKLVEISATSSALSKHYHGQEWESASAHRITSAYIGSSKVAVVYIDRDNSNACKCKIITLNDGSQPSVGSSTTISNAISGSDVVRKLIYDTTNSKLYLFESTFTNNNGSARCIVGTISGTSTSWGSSITLDSSNKQSDYIDAIYMPDHDKVVVAYLNTASQGVQVRLGTPSGGSISFGAAYVPTASSHHPGLVYDELLDKPILAYRKTTDNYGYAKTLTFSGTTLSQHKDIGQITGNGDASQFASGGVYHTAQERVAWSYNKDNTGRVLSMKTAATATNLTDENYIGIAAATASSGATATIDVSGATNSNQSSLTAGQKYYVQNDGSLGLTVATPKVFAGTAISATKLIVNDQQPIAASPAWTKLNSGGDWTTSQGSEAGTIIDGLQDDYSDYRVIKVEFYLHFASTNTGYVGFQFKSGGSWNTANTYHSQCEYGRHTNSSHMSQDTNSNSSITINEDSNDRCENVAGTLSWHRGPNSEDAMLTWDAKGMAYSGANYDFMLFNGAGGNWDITNNQLQGIRWKNSANSYLQWDVVGLK